MPNKLTLEKYWMGRDKAYAAKLTEEIRANATELVEKVSEFLDKNGLPFTGVNSGWRPAQVNAATPGAAKKSNHMRGLAVDLSDLDGSLDAWCLKNLEKLETAGLYLENPAATPRWCHLQIVAPKSGNRVFTP